MNEVEVIKRLLLLSKTAADSNEVPIAAVITRDGEIISEAHNETERKGSFLAHAELLAIERATQNLNTKYLNQCTLYVSIEPCAMCLSAARLSRISSIKFLLRSEKFGERGQAYFHTESGMYDSEEFSKQQLQLLQSFFEKRR